MGNTQRKSLSALQTKHRKQTSLWRRVLGPHLRKGANCGGFERGMMFPEGESCVNTLYSLYLRGEERKTEIASFSFTLRMMRSGAARAVYMRENVRACASMCLVTCLSSRTYAKENVHTSTVARRIQGADKQGYGLHDLNCHCVVIPISTPQCVDADHGFPWHGVVLWVESLKLHHKSTRNKS